MNRRFFLVFFGIFLILGSQALEAANTSTFVELGSRLHTFTGMVQQRLFFEFCNNPEALDQIRKKFPPLVSGVPGKTSIEASLPRMEAEIQKQAEGIVSWIAHLPQAEKMSAFQFLATWSEKAARKQEETLYAYRSLLEKATEEIRYLIGHREIPDKAAMSAVLARLTTLATKAQNPPALSFPILSRWFVSRDEASLFQLQKAIESPILYAIEPESTGKWHQGLPQSGKGVSKPAPVLPSDPRKEPFLWGVSTSGQQWEGNNPNGIWDHFAAKGKTEELCGLAANGLKMYEGDLKLAAGMGLNAFRSSIEWSRIEPRQGFFDPAAIAEYHRMFAAMRANGLKPVVTLIHFNWPQWLEDIGGWASEAGVRAFCRYVDFVSREFKKDIDWWLTYNEPPVLIVAGYILGRSAPGYKNPLLALRVSRSWIRCHRLAYRIIHQNDPVAYVSWNNYTGTYSFGPFGQIYFSAQGDSSPELPDSETTQTLQHEWDNLDVKAIEKDSTGRSMDFIGIDYYCRWRLPGPYVDPELWEIYPEGFYETIKAYHRRFKLPVLIAENGLGLKNGAPRPDGWTREAFLVAHIKQMQRAIREGIPVLGYFHWSITDNWEWGTFKPRFGLYSVDCPNGYYERVPTPAVDVYKKIVKNNGVIPELEAAFPPPKKTPGKK